MWFAFKIAVSALVIGLMGGILLLAATAAFLAGCVSAPTYKEVTQHPLYSYVRPENMDRIMQGQCEIGMNAQECTIAWKDFYFEPVRKAETRSGFYDIYRVNRGDRKTVYLHFKDLILVRIAEYQ